MVIKGILFDLDGVIVDTMHDHFVAWKAAFKDYGADIDKTEYYKLEGRRIIQIAEILAEKYGIPKTEAEKIHDLKLKYAATGKRAKFYEGVKELVSNLKTKGIKIGIVTASVKGFLEEKVDKEFLDKFDVILTGDMYEKGKPDPDPYIQGRLALGLEEEECIVIENAPLGVKAAKAANMYCIAIESTLDKSYLGEADVILEKFGDLKTTDKIKKVLE
ncbi:HAD family phosphatase [Candidatus Pacearchaeota archaeon]|nr:HAD family phosphatase [Candidatus Pacearchaeota archaeon]